MAEAKRPSKVDQIRALRIRNAEQREVQAAAAKKAERQAKRGKPCPPSTRGSSRASPLG